MQNVFRRISNPNSSAGVQALAIYEAAFPPNERNPLTVMQERIASGRNQLFVAEEVEVVFMALLWPLAGSAFTLLDYLATASGARGHGWASRFLEKIFADFRARAEFLILEVEDPDFGSNREERLRRIEFYRKNGALELQGVRYLLPPLQGDEPTEMRLMISPNYPAKTMDPALVRDIVIRLYDELYGRSVDDPLLQASLPAIRHPVPLL